MTNPSLFSLDGKRIVVTGAAGHLGRELCRYLVDDGATVYAVDSRKSALERAKRDIAPSSEAMVTLPADLTDKQARIRLGESLASATDFLDGAVFAAAFVGTSDLEGWAAPFEQQALRSWQFALELNLTAPFHLTQLLEQLLRRGNGPSIVNIGSIYGSMAPDWTLYEGLGLSNPAAYAVSKAGLRQLTKWLATVLAPTIRVNMVSPGGILRDQPAEFVARYNERTPLNRMATEIDIVGQVVNLLSDASSYITGQDILVDGGIVR